MGSVEEWCKILIETIRDCGQELRDLTLKKHGGIKCVEANVYAPPDLARVLDGDLLSTLCASLGVDLKISLVDVWPR